MQPRTRQPWPLALITAALCASTLCASTLCASPAPLRHAPQGVEASVEATGESTRQALFAQTAQRVEALAEWCQSERLYLERDRLYESLLALDPEHADARRFLRYRRSSSGWVRGKYNPPRNHATQALDELAVRRAALAQDWRHALEGLRAAGEEDQDPERFWDELLILAPEDAEARARRGEVRDPAGDGWILGESAVARARRPQLRARADEIRTHPPTVEVGQPGDDEAFLDWSEVRLAPAARVLVAARKPEADEVARRSQAAIEVFRAVFDEAPILPPRLTVCVIEGDARLRRFLEASPYGAPEPQPVQAVSDCFWVARGATLAVSGASAEARAERALRQLIERMLADSFGLGRAVGWAHEGLSLRLAELVRGQAAGVLRHAGLQQEAARWKKGEQPWSAACALMAGDQRPHLSELVDLPLEDFQREHVLLAYLLACYLLEGRTERLVQTLDAIGRAPDAAAALEERLGMDLERLDARLARWAAEVGDAAR